MVFAFLQLQILEYQSNWTAEQTKHESKYGTTKRIGSQKKKKKRFMVTKPIFVKYARLSNWPTGITFGWWWRILWQILWVRYRIKYSSSLLSTRVNANIREYYSVYVFVCLCVRVGVCVSCVLFKSVCTNAVYDCQCTVKYYVIDKMIEKRKKNVYFMKQNQPDPPDSLYTQNVRDLMLGRMPFFFTISEVSRFL